MSITSHVYITARLFPGHDKQRKKLAVEMAHQIDTHSHSDAEVATKPSLDAKANPVLDTEVIDHGLDPNAQSGSKWRRIAGFFWDSIDGDPKYRAYVRRLDLIFL